MRSTLPKTALVLATLLAWPMAVHADGLSVKEAEVRAVPPGSANSAAYMALHNPSDRERRLVDAESPAAASLEIHDHREVDGAMQMRRVEALAIPAGGQARLEPGGRHLMLIGLSEPLAEGEEVAITLRFDDGDTLEITAPVRRPDTGGDGHGGH